MSNVIVLPKIASGEKKPSEFPQQGCAICSKRLGKFQYVYVGLCNYCRKKTASELNLKLSKVTVFTADKATWFLAKKFLTR